MNVLSFKREAIFQEDGSICDPKTGEIRTLHSASSEPEADRTGPEIAAKFIADMFGDNKTEHDVHICRYPNSGGDLPFVKINTRETAAIERFVRKYDKPGSALYFACGTLKPGATGRTKPDVSETGFLWADVDFKDIIEDRATVERRLATLKYPPSCTVFTGHGIHAYWLLSEALDAQIMQDRIEGNLKLLCDLVGGDGQVCEIARVMRLPGSHNSKFDGEWIPVEVLTSNGRRYHLEDIEEMLAETAPMILRKERPRAITAGETDYYAEYGKSRNYKPPIDVKARLDAMMFMGGEINGVHPTQLSVTARSRPGTSCAKRLRTWRPRCTIHRLYPPTSKARHGPARRTPYGRPTRPADGPNCRMLWVANLTLCRAWSGGEALRPAKRVLHQPGSRLLSSLSSAP
jgi:hypothetical protein